MVDRPSTSEPIGRETELRRVDIQLRNGRDVIIVASPMVGLSSFLRRVQRYVRNSDHFIGYSSLYVDCLHFSLDTGSAATAVFRALSEELRFPESVSPTQLVESGFADLLEKLLAVHNNLRLAAIIDNLNALPEHAIRSFLEDVRVVSESRQDRLLLKRVLFVLGGQCLDLRKLDPEHASPFNIAERIFLEDLTESNALELTNNLLSESERPYSRLAATYICYLCGNHPHLLTQICSHLIHGTVPSTRASQKVNFAMIERVVEAMCEEGGDPLLRYVTKALDRLSPEAIECLRRILNGTRYDSTRESPPLRELSIAGLICDSKAPIWTVRNTIYNRYLRQRPCLAPVISEEWFVPRRLFVNLEGYRILFQLENDMRDFVFAKMFEKFGNQWHQKIAPSILTYSQGLKAVELESGWSPNENLPDLAYTQLPQLEKIIEDNWGSIFHLYFKPQRIFTGIFDAIEGIRNRIAHNRPLTDQEIEQLDTYALQLKNCMHDVPVRAMSKSSMKRNP